jgi:hypothetical protein
MYHSPGLRDGVLSVVRVCGPAPPEVLGAESIRTRFTMAGNKFGRSQVRKLRWGRARTLCERASRKMKRTFLDLGSVN